MVTQTLTTCDRCGADATARGTLRIGEQSALPYPMDLCPACARRFLRWISDGPAEGERDEDRSTH